MKIKQSMWAICFVLGCSVVPIASQPQPSLDKRFEIGGHFVYLQRQDANTFLELLRDRGFLIPSNADPANINEFGFGARLGFNFTKHFALEAEANVFPQDKTNNAMPGDIFRVFEPGGRKLQIVGGPKIGIRKPKFGVFGKLHLGVIGMDRYEALVAISPPGTGAGTIEKRYGVYFFNVNVGGVFELYPSRRTIVRFDAGDTWINYRALEPKDINPSIKRHNFQFSAGFGFRF